jgi:hypothetical protein
VGNRSLSGRYLVRWTVHSINLLGTSRIAVQTLLRRRQCGMDKRSIAALDQQRSENADAS